MRPKIDAPAAFAPLIWNPDAYSVATTRRATARKTGPPRSRPRKTDRRDHNIWPSDKSNTRIADEKRLGGVRTGFGVRGSAFGVRLSGFGVRRSAFGVSGFMT